MASEWTIHNVKSVIRFVRYWFILLQWMCQESVIQLADAPIITTTLKLPKRWYGLNWDAK